MTFIVFSISKAKFKWSAKAKLASVPPNIYTVFTFHICSKLHNYTHVSKPRPWCPHTDRHTLMLQFTNTQNTSQTNFWPACVLASARCRRGEKHSGAVWLGFSCRWAVSGRLVFCVLFTVIWTVWSDVTARVSGTVVQLRLHLFRGRSGFLICLSRTLIIICL